MNTDERVQAYASAFFEAALERWAAALNGVAEAVAKNPKVAERVAYVVEDFAARHHLLDQVIPGDADLPVRNLLLTLIQSGEVKLLPDIVVALRERVRRTEVAPVPVEVVSAIALTAEQRNSLVAKLEAQYGANLSYSYRVDPAILGGLIVRVGDKLIDGSVASKLTAMKQALGVSSNE
jgi:F-type H+-transporting ATPase subunit delta